MSQQKPTGERSSSQRGKTEKTGSRSTAGKNQPPAPENSSASPNDKYTVKPEFWDSVMDAIPPWSDEIAALLLIVFGLVSFLSLLNVSDGNNTIAAAWSNALRGLFGYGSAIVCGGLFALGVILLLPRAGIIIRFPARRILALEMAFFAALALLHLTSGDDELLALARLGQGGGLVGWAFSSLTVSIVGVPVSIVIFSILFAISTAVVIGIRRDHIKIVLNRASAWLKLHGKRLKPESAPRPIRVSTLDEAMSQPRTTISAQGLTALAMPTEAQVQRAKAFHIMRIRPDRDRLPPSMRSTESTTITETSIAEDLTLSGRREMPTSFNAIGQVKGKPAKGSSYVPVERPDGRVKRYFVVSNMHEPKSTLKRDAALPPMDLMRDVTLNLPDEREINNNVVLIENTLLEFDIDVDVADVKVGPTVTQFAVQPYRENANGGGEVTFSRTRISKIASLSSDLALALSARRLRLETPIPGTNTIGIEVPNHNPSTVALRSVYESKMYQDESARQKSPLFVPLGRDVAGAPVGINLAQMPHMLVAGTTGSGKSVCIAALAAALILDNTPATVRMVMLDPKMVELSRFNGIPHLLGPVETDQERMIGVLRWLTREMDRRYKVLEEHSSRNIDIYNSRLGRRRKEDHMPYIMIFIDEIGDLMLSQPEATEKTVARLAQMARAVGMHMIVATQRPSVDVLTGLIKANFPSRISFAVASGTDSRVILDAVGAENLIGRGDMLYQAADAMAPRRLQGCFISDDEVRAITQYWKDRAAAQGETTGEQTHQTAPWERGLTRREFLSETDPLLEQAISMVIADQEASASMIQRKLGIGYPRAARMMDLLVELGIVGDFKADRRSREVLIKQGEDPFKDLIDKRMNKA